jgi:bifunctional ADP-heptose synthase (sugar kinase/adenylyltransferase)
MLTTELIEHILSTIPHRTIGVLGDLFLDRYLDIDASLNEPSVETDLTAYQVVRVRSYPGAAGTVINNLSALGVGRICPIAAIGDDGEGYELQQALRATRGVDLSGLVVTPERRTPTYTKPMLKEKGQDPRELNRLDIKNRTSTPANVEERILKLLDDAWPRLNAVLVLDQVSEIDCGVVTKRVRDWLAERCEREPKKFVMADSREQIGLFRNVCVKPNTMELLKATRAAGNAKEQEGVRLAEQIRGTVFFTDGPNGIVVCRHAVKIDHAMSRVPAFRVTGPIDICGAGDSTYAGIASAMVSGTTHEQAAAFGNLVASITIQQIGVTGTANPDQVRARWREV